MKARVRQRFNSFLGHFGVRVVRKSQFTSLETIPAYGLVSSIFSKSQTQQLYPHFLSSKSGLGQDLFVLGQLKMKRDGYFVEFGACDGVTDSNTWLLEKHFGWKGILAEPAKSWHSSLSENRACHVDFRCLSKKSRELLEFIEIASVQNNKINYQLSGLVDFADNGDWASSLRRTSPTRYKVETVSLMDLLEFWHAPLIIDYLSVDTEGSEFLVLEDFDFSKYQFRIISVEHNFTKKRKKIYELLTDRGYQRVFQNISRNDDWYVHSSFSEV